MVKYITNSNSLDSKAYPKYFWEMYMYEKIVNKKIPSKKNFNVIKVPWHSPKSLPSVTLFTWAWLTPKSDKVEKIVTNEVAKAIIPSTWKPKYFFTKISEIKPKKVITIFEITTILTLVEVFTEVLSIIFSDMIYV